MIAKKLYIYEPTISELEKRYVYDCLESGWISSTGEMVERFGKTFADYLGAKYAVPVSSGTSALHLALLAYGIRSGDEVICPAFTFAATANAVIYAGAKPVLVDVSGDSLALDPLLIEKAITKKTKAIIVAHLYGMPADLAPIKKICKKHKLILIEDAAEALGAKYGRKFVGTIGDVGCYSFYGNKTVTTGEGGMVVTNNRRMAQKIKYLASHGMHTKKRYWHNDVGYNYRMTSLQAAIGLAQMERADEIIAYKKRISKEYDEQLGDVSSIRVMKKPKYGTYVCWLYTIFLPSMKQRNALAQHLEINNVETRKTFYVLSDMPPYKTSQKFPQSKKISHTGLSLPSSPLLRSEDIKYVSTLIKNFISKHDNKSAKK